jgi:hypothetical protein
MPVPAWAHAGAFEGGGACGPDAPANGRATPRTPTAPAVHVMGARRKACPAPRSPEGVRGAQGATSEERSSGALNEHRSDGPAAAGATQHKVRVMARQWRDSAPQPPATHRRAHLPDRGARRRGRGPVLGGKPEHRSEARSGEPHVSARSAKHDDAPGAGTRPVRMSRWANVALWGGRGQQPTSAPRAAGCDSCGGMSWVNRPRAASEPAGGQMHACVHPRRRVASSGGAGVGLALASSPEATERGRCGSRVLIH